MATALLVASLALLAFSLWVHFGKPEDPYRPTSPSWIVGSAMAFFAGLGCLLGFAVAAL